MSFQPRDTRDSGYKRISKELGKKKRTTLLPELSLKTWLFALRHHSKENHLAALHRLDSLCGKYLKSSVMETRLKWMSYLPDFCLNCGYTNHSGSNFLVCSLLTHRSLSYVSPFSTVRWQLFLTFHDDSSFNLTLNGITPIQTLVSQHNQIWD